MKEANLTWDNVEANAMRIAVKIADIVPSLPTSFQLLSNPTKPPLKIYGVPRGGIYAAQAVQAALTVSDMDRRVILVEEPDSDCIFVDDVIDTGKTRDGFISEYEYPNLPFYALIDKIKTHEFLKGTWVSFPWERMLNENGPTQNVRRLIEYIGDDPNREGLEETPIRVIRSYEKLFSGYKQEPTDIIKVFEDDDCDEMVILKNIQFYSTCEHHMLPFFGKAHIAYIPDKRVIGVSKLIRILEIYTRRLSIQERIGQQVTNTLQTCLCPRGAACVLEAQHFCMTARGVEKQDSIMITSSLTGAFKKSTEARNEFLKMIRG